MREVTAMLNEESRRKLKEIGMPEIIAAMDIQSRSPDIQSLPFDERMQMIVDYVHQEKYNSRIQRMLQAAKFRFPQADMKSMVYEGRGLDKNLIVELSACQYISQHRSIVLQGPTGSGKTFLGCALGRNACINRIKTRYIRLPDLLMEYGDAVAITGQVRKIQNRYASVPLLILDEWLVSDIFKDELHFLFELMERRSDSTSTIFCTQYRKEDWVKRLGRSVQAEAIVDRYAYSAYWIEMGTKNMREYCANLPQ